MLLEAKNIEVTYGKIAAVVGVSIQVPPASIVTIIGPNGAGKTSLLNAIAGLNPGSGQVIYDGRDITAFPLEMRVRMGLCLVPESRELFGEMSVADNLLLGGFTQTSKDLAALRSEVYELFPRLRERAGQAADTLSGGERQMLALGRALMSRPRMLLLDEPSLGLAPIIIREMFELIKKVQSRGTSILLVEQNARMALKVADYAYLLEQGQVVLEGPASEVAGNPRVVGTYLGMGKKSSAPEQLSP